LIYSERNIGNKVSFSVRRPVLNFLQELFEKKLLEKELLKKSFSYLKDFEVGFTHFIELTEEPDISTLNSIWVRRGAMHFKRNQEGSYFGLVIKHKAEERFGALVIQIKDYVDKQSQTEEMFAAGCRVEPRITFSEDCAESIKDSYLGIYVHIGAAYKDTPGLIPSRYDPPITRSSTSKTAPPNSDKNRLIVHGLGSFKFEHRNILESILCAWNDPIRISSEREKHFLYYMLPCAYERAKKRLQVSDEQEESLVTAKKRKQSKKSKK